MRLLGIQIANGYSPEARVFAGLIDQRAAAYDAAVLHHDWPGDAKNSAHRFTDHSGVEVRRIDTGYRPNPGGERSTLAKVGSHLRFRIALPQMLRMAREFDPDVIYSCQQRWDCMAASYIARKLEKPQIVHLHYTIGPWLGRQALKTLLECDHVITVSDFIRGEALRHGVRADRVTTLLNSFRPFPEPDESTGRRIRRELGVPLSAPLAGIVARVADDKGQRDTIEAFEQVLAHLPEARLLVVGDGPARPHLEKLVERAELDGSIIFTGRRSDVPDILASLDLFVHPSRNDPCPLAVLEAAAAGLPIVAYDEGGIPEIVADGETALLGPTTNVTALGENMLAILDDRDLSRRMGHAARERIATKFRPEEAGAVFGRLIRDVASRGEVSRSELVSAAR